MMQVAVIVLNWNGKENTIACLSSLEKQSLPKSSYEIIVVDNGSVDGSVEEIKKAFPSITLLVNKTNTGFSEGNNVGMRYALKNNAINIAIINNDTIAHKDLLKELLIVLEENISIGITVPKIYFAKGYEFHKQRYKESETGKVLWYAGGIIDWDNVIGYHRGVDKVDKGQYDIKEKTDYGTGCCMMIKASVLQNVGLFDRKYFLYYEDSDISMRVKKAKNSIYYVPKAILWHKNALSAGGSGSLLQDYYITRNRLLFGMRYAPLKTKLSLLKESVLLLRNGRKWQKRGVMDFYLQRFGKGSYSL